MRKILLLALLAITFIGPVSAQQNKQQDIENAFKNSIDDSRFKIHLKRLTERPHVAGSKSNELVRDYINDIMDKAEFKVKKYPYDVYIPSSPGESLIEIVTPKRQTLTQQEDILKEDPFSSDSLLWKGWNCIS